MPSTPVETPRYCSVNSIQRSEALIGNAPRTDYWILLEYPYPMEAKALKQNRLPQEVNRYLAEIQEALPASRLLLVRRKSSKPGSSISLILVDGRDRQAKLHKLALEHYADLPEVDIPAIFTGSGDLRQVTDNDRIFLVCTNGKRDACCAKWGLPLYNTLEKHLGDMIYQTSHVGGHRFAPNLICLPHGIYYGRVPISRAPWIAEQYLSGQLALEYYRGLAAYPAPAQAAEYFLLVEKGDDIIGAYHLEEITPLGEDRWMTRFSSETNQVSYRIYLEAFQTGEEIFESCNAPDETKPIRHYRLLEPLQAG